MHVDMKSNDKSSVKTPARGYVPILKGVVDIFLEQSQHRPARLRLKIQDTGSRSHVFFSRWNTRIDLL